MDLGPMGELALLLVSLVGVAVLVEGMYGFGRMLVDRTVMALRGETVLVWIPFATHRTRHSGRRLST